ncbi:hypothetical protein Bca4012_009299 [Brassica carinata]|uniref:Uncharacterized protein n=1 Tax=Brassica carinata TaxID=52824 RepID=A0A8X7RYW8_BRACI|nr:hypothetical protein Bca52824_034560 [Brassica carinata]
MRSKYQDFTTPCNENHNKNTAELLIGHNENIDDSEAENTCKAFRGDTSCAKSPFLRKSSSAAGLTATVAKEPENVLGNGIGYGHEFDTMDIKNQVHLLSMLEEYNLLRQ